MQECANFQLTTEESEGESSPSTPRDVPSADDTISVSGSPLLTQNCKQQKKSGGKLQFGRLYYLAQIPRQKFSFSFQSSKIFGQN